MGQSDTQEKEAFQKEVFPKKSIIFSENMGVCRVDDITGLSVQRANPVAYYVLRSVYRKDKTAYIPVEGHDVVLRPLISREEAQEKIKDWKEAGVWMLEQEENSDAQDIREQDTITWRLQYEMADTLPREECRLLYEQGEADYVMKEAQKA